MTIPTAALCGHRWTQTVCVASGYSAPSGYSPHLCERPARHERDMMLHQPPTCRCRCGATTTRKET